VSGSRLLAENSWIDFRSNIYELQDVAQAWGGSNIVKESILARFHGPITEHLTEEVIFYF
jgi:hypothetical protein